VWLEGLSKMKNSVTSSGLEPTTFQLVGLVSQPTTLPRAPHSDAILFLITVGHHIFSLSRNAKPLK
jgi:hypothetical protein